MQTSDENVQAAVAQEVNKRMEKALGEIADKYEKLDIAKAEQAARAAEEAKAQERRAEHAANQQEVVQDDDEEDSDAEFLEGLDDDPDLARLRELRLAQMKAEQQSRSENLGKGHGEYRDIVQDEFLPEVTGSKNVIVHFYHKNFEKCKIMDKHLALLAPHHIEAKFLKIDAEKAPFFVAKLQIPVLPTVVLFVDGVACGRVVGFEGLTDEDAPSRDEWETYRLAEKLAEGGVIEYRDIDGVTCNEDARAAEAAQAASAIRRGFHTRHVDDDL